MDNVTNRTHVLSVMRQWPLAAVVKVTDEQEKSSPPASRSQAKQTDEGKNPHSDQAVNRKTQLIRKVVRIAARILATGFSPSLFIGSWVGRRKFGRKQGGGQTLWYAIVFCEMSKISWQTGKHRTKDDFQNHSEGPSFFLEQWLNIIRPHCTDNTSNDPFSRCRSVQQLATDQNGRSQNTVLLQVEK